MSKVIERTAYQVELFNIDTVEDEIISTLFEECTDEYNVAIINDKYEVDGLDIKTALNCGKDIANSLNEDSRYVVIKGSLVTKTLMDIINSFIS